MEPWAFFGMVAPTRSRRRTATTTGWVAIWDQFLIQKDRRQTDNY